MYQELKKTTHIACQGCLGSVFFLHAHTHPFPGPTIQLQTPVLFNRSWHQIGIISV